MYAHTPTVGQYLNPTGYQLEVPPTVSFDPYKFHTDPLTGRITQKPGFDIAKDQLKANVDKMSLYEKTQGILGTVGSIMQAYNAYNANKLAKQQHQRAIYESDRNYENQKQLTNSRLEDRQRRRVDEAAHNGTQGIPTVAQYLKQYSIK